MKAALRRRLAGYAVAAWLVGGLVLFAYQLWLSWPR